jgi:uncharacterized protein YndB with AHSA1/START domain
MTRIYTTTFINKPVEEVFDYVTSPGSWPQWHPSSLGVSGVTDRSMQVGEQCTEEFEVAGRKGSAVWMTRERQAPNRWVIDGKIIGSQHGGGRVTYTLTPQAGGTFFEREFVYPTASLLFKLLDLVIIRRRVRAESEEAMRRLKKALEQKASKEEVQK